MSNATKTRKPRQRRQHQRSVALLCPPIPGDGASYVRITQDGQEFFYWIERVPSDFGTAFRVKSVTDGGDAYDVLLSSDGDSCTCKGHTFGGYCKHVDAIQALPNLGSDHVF